jgi:hypothetical protein
MIRTLAILIALATVAGCNDAARERTRPASTTVLSAHSTQRASLQIVGADTLSDSARILRILPEQDGDATVAIFSDPVRRISAGLAINDRRMANPQLIWPDSVTGVWWTGSHTLAFTTSNGQGIRLVVDVHAATLKIADTTRVGAGAPAALVVDSSVSERARTYIDSVYVQPAGVSTQPLTYSVIRVVPSPDGTLAAFYSAARDVSGKLSNPSWFVLDRSSGAVAALDQVTGAITEISASAGEWGGNTSFFYTKGNAIWEAEIQKVTSPATPR